MYTEAQNVLQRRFLCLFLLFSSIIVCLKGSYEYNGFLMKSVLMKPQSINNSTPREEMSVSRLWRLINSWFQKQFEPSVTGWSFKELGSNLGNLRVVWTELVVQRGDASDVYLGGTQLESSLGTNYRKWVIVILSSYCRQLPGWYLSLIRPLPSMPFPFHCLLLSSYLAICLTPLCKLHLNNSTYRCPCDPPTL